MQRVIKRADLNANLPVPIQGEIATSTEATCSIGLQIDRACAYICVKTRCIQRYPNIDDSPTRGTLADSDCKGIRACPIRIHGERHRERSIQCCRSGVKCGEPAWHRSR